MRRAAVPKRKVITALTALTLASAALPGCAGEQSSAAAGGLGLRVVLPDTNIREPDVPCSGARAFRFAHPGAAFRIQDADGHDVATGELPEGVAEPAFTFDMGDARQPTVCVMTLTIDGVASLDGHWLVIGERRPVAIAPNASLDDVPEAILQ